MWYEMLEHETLDDLIRYAGNFSSKAYTENLTLHRKDDNANVAFTVNFTQYPYFHLKMAIRYGLNRSFPYLPM